MSRTLVPLGPGYISGGADPDRCTHYVYIELQTSEGPTAAVEAIRVSLPTLEYLEQFFVLRSRALEVERLFGDRCSCASRGSRT